MKRLPIGISDFKKLRENNFYYVDKTLLIKELLDKKSEVALLPRPRRFGKTLNLSMLYYFFSNTEHAGHLFENTMITQYSDIMQHQGNYPVIFLTFKDVKVSSWSDAFERIAALIYEEYSRFQAILMPYLSGYDQSYYNTILQKKANKTELEDSLKRLSYFISTYYQKKAIILLDEYDAPIHVAYINGYYKEIVEFIRNLFSGALKDNSALEMGILTGILRTAKEGIFSGLNNLEVCTILHEDYADKFGFTQPEVDQLLTDFAMQEQSTEIKKWYNGYQFAGITIYNPWSLLNCVSKKGQLLPYWANTSDNALIMNVLAKASDITKIKLESLLSGNTIREEVDEGLIFPGIERQQIAVWSLLLFSGYLTPRSQDLIEGIWTCDLGIPNKEILILYKTLIKNAFGQSIPSLGLERLFQALRDGDGSLFEKIMQEYLINSISMFDLPDNEPEKSYHLFVLGLLVILSDTYEIYSNRESGYGRYDIVLIPKNTQQRGIIIEFKKVDTRETLEDAAQRALQQVHEKQYATQLHKRGIHNITSFGIAFEGKEVLSKQEN